MTRDRLLLGLAAVFAGLTVVLAVAALAAQPFLLLLAVPFGAMTYFLWVHATGRLAARAHRRARIADGAGTGSGATVESAGPFGRPGRTASGGPGGPWSEDARSATRDGGKSAKDATGTSSAGHGSAGAASRRAGARAAQTGTGRRRRSAAPPRQDSESLPVAQAREVLDVDPAAGPETLRRAYRERVKEVHPDAEHGDEASFRGVVEAYQTLRASRDDAEP